MSLIKHHSIKTYRDVHVINHLGAPSGGDNLRIQRTDSGAINSSNYYQSKKECINIVLLSHFIIWNNYKN